MQLLKPSFTHNRQIRQLNLFWLLDFFLNLVFKQQTAAHYIINEIQKSCVMRKRQAKNILFNYRMIYLQN